MAEFFLYGRTEYDEVLEFTSALREAGEKQESVRAVAFAATVAGEAYLMSGDLDAAIPSLEEGVTLHRAIGSNAGEALSLQRLAEAHLELGDSELAELLLDEALPLARWSLLSHHLIQRTYGTMILAAADAEAAIAVVRQAEEAIGPSDACRFCTVMIAVPSAIACAHAGELEQAHEYLESAQQSCENWIGTAWPASVSEARAHVAAAEGLSDEAIRHFSDAAALFSRSGQPRAAARCERGQHSLEHDAA